MAELLKVEGYGFDKVRSMLKSLDSTVSGIATDKVVSDVAAEGRKLANDVDAKGVKLGGMTSKYHNKKLHQGGTVWDQKLGGYKARSGSFRMINFSFEQSARKTPGRKFSKVSVSSQIQNLWANSTKPYKASSPLFKSDSKRGWGRWRQGTSRGARVSWSAFATAIAQGMPIGIKKTELWLDGQIRNGVFKTK